MPAWWDSLFGDVPDRPNNQRQPSSRGALLGMGNYQNMPTTKSTIEDRRADPYADHAAWMKAGPSTDDAQYAVRHYAPPITPDTHRPAWSDPMLDAGPTLSQGATDPDTYDYPSSFKRNMNVRPTGVAPYRVWPNATDQDSPYGPNLPRRGQAYGYDVRSGDLPYIGPHLPIAPGDPGWTPPPSPSGPHNRGGDPARPGYDSPVMPMDVRGITLNSPPWGY